jgi:hypothetical protein
MYVNPGSARVSLLASTLYGLLCIALQEQQQHTKQQQVHEQRVSEHVLQLALSPPGVCN